MYQLISFFLVSHFPTANQNTIQNCTLSLLTKALVLNSHNVTLWMLNYSTSIPKQIKPVL